MHVLQARFDNRKSSWKPVEDSHACFDYCNACWEPVEVQQGSFNYRIACRRTVGVYQARFDYRPGCVFTHTRGQQEASLAYALMSMVVTIVIQWGTK